MGNTGGAVGGAPGAHRAQLPHLPLRPPAVPTLLVLMFVSRCRGGALFKRPPTSLICDIVSDVAGKSGSPRSNTSTCTSTQPDCSPLATHWHLPKRCKPHRRLLMANQHQVATFDLQWQGLHRYTGCQMGTGRCD